MFRKFAIATAAALVLTGLTAAPSVAAPPGADDDAGPLLSAYTGTVSAKGLDALLELGVDRHEIHAVPTESGDFTVEVTLSPEQAESVEKAGADLEIEPLPDAASDRLRTFAGTPEGVFRTYLGETGLQAELAAQADAYPRIAELVSIGETVQGTSIDAVRVTRNATRVPDGSRPATVFLSAQHAREWITPEMTRRLLDLVLTSYGSDREITRLVNTTELWFIPVANPDGYDFTFEPGQRLWRKNLADNNGDGAITNVDGVDLNRNFPTRWGYDNEGSSPNPTSLTYRGPSPASEPETQALNELFDRISPEFLINYHSAAELLLYGLGWQVATPSPDDVIYESMVGDDANPAVPGYDPDISAELYTTNGDTDTHMQEAFGTLGFTPEMSTCEAAVASDPDDEWELPDCAGGQGFTFPDDEELIQAEFEKNIPFALAVAKSALDPNDPVSVVGLDTPDLVIDPFEVSYGNPQPVAVTAKRDLLLKLVNYRVNGGRTQLGFVSEWQGGERYGDENDDYYAEYRGVIRNTKPGDSVEVWFTAFPSIRDILFGNAPLRQIQSERFTYTVASDTNSPALIIANEDYTGVNPTYPAGTTAPKYLDEHVAAFEANGVTPDTWDVDAQGVPHHLGVLSHYAAVTWYLGDNRLTQDPEDEITEIGAGGLPDASVAERTQYLTLAVRDYLNEGGKLVYAGETTGYYGVLGGQLGGIFYGLDGAPDQPCVITQGQADECLLYADDFTQYWLGAYARTPIQGTGVIGTAPPLEGLSAVFGGPAVADNPVDEAGSFVVTSDVLPPDEFPQFASRAVGEDFAPDGPFTAIEGDWAAGATHIDDGYQRLGRTYDLSALTAADAPAFEAQFSWDVEEAYDHVIVEARVPGTEDWTTLAEASGLTSSDVPADCEQGFYLELHPQLENYLTPGDPCLPTGTTGEWNALTGSSGGWTPVSYDLTDYVGGEVELVVSYVTDPAFGNVGVIIDDTKLVTTAGESEAEGFEVDLGAWSVLGAPESSPENSSDWERTDALSGTTVIATEDSLLLGFGLEQLESDAARAAVVERAIGYLLG